MTFSALISCKALTWVALSANMSLVMTEPDKKRSDDDDTEPTARSSYPVDIKIQDNGKWFTVCEHHGSENGCCRHVFTFEVKCDFNAKGLVAAHLFSGDVEKLNHFLEMQRPHLQIFRNYFSNRHYSLDEKIPETMDFQPKLILWLEYFLKNVNALNSVESCIGMDLSAPFYLVDGDLVDGDRNADFVYRVHHGVKDR